MIRYLATAWFFLLVAAGCTPVDPPQAEKPDSQSQLPDHQVWGWSSTVTRGGRKKAHVRAGEFRKFDRDEKAELLGGVEVVFFGGSGDTVSVLGSAQGTIFEATGKLEVSGAVVLVSEDGTKLETEQLHWDRQTELITGIDRVTLTRSEGTETGIGFEATSDLKTWKLNQVETHVHTQPTVLP